MENKEMRFRDVAYTVNRSVLHEQDLGGPAPNPTSSVRSFFGAAKRKLRCSVSAAKHILFQFIPILHWLPRYPVKEWLLGDIVSGVSVGILQLPQGLAYALLAGVPPVFGLYSSFFPVMVYSIFGTSRHVSIGSFAVVSIMIGSVTESLVPNDNFILPGNDSLHIDTVARDKARVEVVAAMTLLVGLFQIILGLVQFGFVVTYLSEPLIRGYTTAATIHVTVSQLKHIFGLPLSERSQPLSLILSLISLFRRIHRTNIGTLVIGLVSLTCLFAVKEVNQRLRGKFPMPIPIELIVLIISTGISYGINLHEKYGVGIVGDIPTGFVSTTRLVTPMVPKAEFFAAVVGNAFAIAVVGYTITISLAKMFAMKHGYKVDSNQELIALGFSNLVGSFFHCFAVTTSMSRTLVQESTGGNTQVAGTVSALIILVIILKAGELFTCLPRAILSAIVIANLKGMYKQFMDIPVLWRTNKYDLLIWLVAFLSTICLNMDIGLAVSVVFGLFTVTFRSQLPHYSILGQVFETDLYRDPEESSMVKEISGIKIFHWNTAIYFANAELYSKALKTKMGVNVDKLIEKKKKAVMKRKKGLQKVICLAKNILAKTQMGTGLEFLTNKDGMLGSLRTLSETIPNAPTLLSLGLEKLDFHSLILDFSAVSFIDTVGVKKLKNIFEEFREIEVDVYLASCPTSVFRQLEHSHFFKGSIGKASVFASVHDAVSYLSSGTSESSSLQEITEI
ncbi:solute carrier family 26 member 6-like isoform X1 [Xenopus tropicalis]|uniref:Solute carrier family 26 member 6 n=1 Tax=Xenopus tropicalis TaxID=8364 RepID=A0A6I8SFZ9_XENTR|nr:solute carrier family 26 member 6-like isoform X1 [Xenopus tropicalis]|eukprot:XP_012817139.1 PREDICTED: solute carrier family 26 member 6-like isoform X1 [Xenopus tropicalis]